MVEVGRSGYKWRYGRGGEGLGMSGEVWQGWRRSGYEWGGMVGVEKVWV